MSDSPTTEPRLDERATPSQTGEVRSTSRHDESESPIRRTIRWVTNLIILIGLVVQLARICQVESKDGDVPFLSANDRSRWCTMEALVGQGTYQIDDLIFEDSSQRRRTPWYSIDLVRHRAEDGQLHYYSSKPPLLPTIYAGVYGVVRLLTGHTLLSEPFLVARIVLVLVNLLPFGLFLWFFNRWFQQSLVFASSSHGDRAQAVHRDSAEEPVGSNGIESKPAGLKDTRSKAFEPAAIWASLIWASFLAWGTFLGTFVVSLNNHLPAAILVGISIWCLDRILIRGDSRLRWFSLCALCTSFAAANELPALGWVVAAGTALALCFPKRTLIAYVPSLLPIALAFFGTNYLAHKEFSPAYAHRDSGARILAISIESGAAFMETAEIVDRLQSAGLPCSVDCQIRPARRANTFELFDRNDSMQYALIVDEEAGEIAAHEWGDWYDFPGAYWAGDKQGVDKGEPNRAWYIMHCLVGHHGIFSLTPFWFVSLLGFGCIVHRRSSFNFLRDRRLLIALIVLGTTVITVGFYFARGLEDRNYGGVTSGFRWTFWLIPLWLWLAKDVLANIHRPALRRTIEILVVLSAFSAIYPWENPWTSPWPMQWMDYMDLL